jgi:transposase
MLEDEIMEERGGTKTKYCPYDGFPVIWAEKFVDGKWVCSVCGRSYR